MSELRHGSARRLPIHGVPAPADRVNATENYLCSVASDADASTSAAFLLRSRGVDGATVYAGDSRAAAPLSNSAPKAARLATACSSSMLAARRPRSKNTLGLTLWRQHSGWPHPLEFSAVRIAPERVCALL